MVFFPLSLFTPMSTTTQLATRTMTDRTRQPASPSVQQTQQPDQAQAIDLMDNAPPPPYSESDDFGPEDLFDPRHVEEQPPQHKLTINADHKISGQGNLVPINPSALADATKFSAILLKAITQLNAAAAAANADGDGRTRQICVDLTINCGVSVVGHRNVVGHMGMKRKMPVVPGADGPAAAADEGAVVGGAKRKADDDDDDDDDDDEVRLTPA